MSDIFRGRIGRERYWRLTGLCMLAFTTAFVLIVPTINSTGTRLADYLALVVVAIAVFLFLATCVALLGAGVRRLHDRGKSGFWIVLYYLVPLMTAVWSVEPEGRGEGLGWIAPAILLWAMIDLGILEGKPADKPCGPAAA
jgi:uncharacterized membrane protein YhaH (DUF805 family)